MTKGNGASWLSWTDAKAARTIGLTSAVFRNLLASRGSEPACWQGCDCVAKHGQAFAPLKNASQKQGTSLAKLIGGSWVWIYRCRSLADACCICMWHRWCGRWVSWNDVVVQQLRKHFACEPCSVSTHTATRAWPEGEACCLLLAFEEYARVSFSCGCVVVQYQRSREAEASWLSHRRSTPVMLLLRYQTNLTGAWSISKWAQANSAFDCPRFRENWASDKPDGVVLQRIKQSGADVENTRQARNGGRSFLSWGAIWLHFMATTWLTIAHLWTILKS
jgi:hypothetical protein